MVACTFVGVGSGELQTTVHSPSCTAAGFGQSSSSSSHAICSVCSRSMLVTKVGLLRDHRPLGNTCTGSEMLIVSPSFSINATSVPIIVSAGSTTSTGVTSDVSVDLANHVKDRDSVSGSLTVNSFFHPTSICIIK